MGRAAEAVLKMDEVEPADPTLEKYGSGVPDPWELQVLKN